MLDPRDPQGLTEADTRRLHTLAAMSRPDDVTPGAVSSSACLICGYALTGLANEAKCPECEASVVDSRDGRTISTAPANYVRGLARGALLAEIGAAGMVAVGVLGTAWTLGSSWAVDRIMASDPSAAGDFVNMMNWFIMMFGVMSVLLVTCESVGWWRIVRPDPRFASKDVVARSRAVMRVSVVVLPLALAVSVANSIGIMVVVDMFDMPSVRQNDLIGLFRTASWAGWVAATGAYAARFFSALVYTRALSRRVGDMKLLRMATRLFWLGPLLAIADLAVEGVISDSYAGLAWGALLGGADLALAVAWLLVWVGMIHRLRNDLLRCARPAEY